ncbi:MAG: shikimate kinase [Ignavibacteria bacterium]|nr:shikimate kinase [Ignavibacteria bacterium]
MRKKIYYLTGFMAAGKSTIGPILANTLGWNFLDLDKAIEEEEVMKITEIFETKGEEHFRNKELEILKAISKKNHLIVALGGGTIARRKNLKLIKETGRLIYLHSSPEIAYKRLVYKRNRPALLFEGEELPTKQQFLERIKSLMSDRKEYYEQADYIIDTDAEVVGRTVDKLARIIENDH